MKLIIFLGVFIAVSGFIGLQNSEITVSKPADDWDLPEGTYYILSKAGANKYLDVSWSCKDEPNCKVQLWSLGSTTTNDKWVIKRAGLPLVSPYTLKSVCNNKYLTGIGDDNGDGLDVQARLGLTDSWRGRQEWRFKFVNSAYGAEGVFKIYNDVKKKYLDVVNGCVNENGCKMQV